MHGLRNPLTGARIQDLGQLGDGLVFVVFDPVVMLEPPALLVGALAQGAPVDFIAGTALSEQSCIALVLHHVTLQLRQLNETFPAFGARVRLGRFVRVHVAIQRLFGSETSVALKQEQTSHSTWLHNPSHSFLLSFSFALLPSDSNVRRPVRPFSLSLFLSFSLSLFLSPSLLPSFPPQQ